MTAPKTEAWSRLSLAKLREKAAEHKIEIPEGATKTTAYHAILRGLSDRLDAAEAELTGTFESTEESEEQMDVAEENQRAVLQFTGGQIEVPLIPANTVHQALAQVMRAVGPVAKALKNIEGQYAARSIDDVMDALHKPMADAGILCIPTVEERTAQPSRTGKQTEVVLRVRWTFHGPAGDSIDAVTYGEALDSSDKATNKALQASLKYLLLDTFLVPLSVSDDADRHSPQREDASLDYKPASKARLDEVTAQARELGLGQWVKDQGFPWPYSNDVCDAIAAKAAEVKAEQTATAQRAYVDVAVCDVCGNPTDDHEEQCPHRPFGGHPEEPSS